MPKGQYTRKKKSKPAPEPTPAVTDDLKMLQLDEVTLLKLEKYQAQIRATNSEIVIAQSMRQNFLQKIDPANDLQKFDLKLQTLQRERGIADESYKILLKSAGEKLGVNLTDYSYDDETGVLRKINNDEGLATPS